MRWSNGLLCRSSVLQQGESVIFNTTVEKSALKRRASRLLAMAGGAPWRKSRELVLTDRRLLCLKSTKPGRAFQISNDFLLKTPDGKDARNTVIGVEAKGEREIVILTVGPRSVKWRDMFHADLLCALLQGSKSHIFITSSPSLASTWVRKIREATETSSNSLNTTPQLKNGASSTNTTPPTKS